MKFYGLNQDKSYESELKNFRAFVKFEIFEDLKIDRGLNKLPLAAFFCNLDWIIIGSLIMHIFGLEN